MYPEKLYSVNNYGIVTTHELLKAGQTGWDKAAWYRDYGAVAKLINIHRLQNMDDGRQYYVTKKEAILKAIEIVTHNIKNDKERLKELKNDLNNW